MDCHFLLWAGEAGGWAWCLPDPGIKPASPALQVGFLPLSHLGSPRAPQGHPQYRAGRRHLQEPKDLKTDLEATRCACETGQNNLSWMCALGQTPNANRFCHQDTEGLDTDQLLLPGTGCWSAEGLSVKLMTTVRK